MFGEYLHTYLHATSALGVCCVAVFLGTNKILPFIYKEILDSKQNSLCAWP